jgi:hypothetical protein
MVENRGGHDRGEMIFFHGFPVRILDQFGDHLILNLILIIPFEDGPGGFSGAESLDLYIPIQSPVSGLHLLGYDIAGDLEQDFPLNGAGFFDFYLHALLKLLKGNYFLEVFGFPAKMRII